MFGGLHCVEQLPSEATLVDLARSFSPRVEPLGATPVIVDLHGLGRAWSSPQLLGEALRAAGRARALELQVALAWTRVAALVLARGRPGVTIVPAGGEAKAVAPLSLSLLDLSSEHLELFRRWGIERFGDLQKLPARGLAERLGPEGPRLHRLARGEDESPLVPQQAPQSFEMRLELDWPVDGLEPLSFLLARVLEPLCKTLKERGRRAAAMTLELGLVDGSKHRRSLRPAMPTVEARTWRTLLLLDLETHSPRDAVASLLLRVDPTPARAGQLSLLDPQQPSPERLAETLARLAAHGVRAGSATLLDTHRPGAFVMGTFAPAGKPFDGAPLPRVSLRVFRPPLAAHVEIDDGAPRFLAAPGVRGVVASCAGPWHASGDWWDEMWSREEWDVSLESGGVYRIFLDRIREAWFIEGELD